MSPWAFSPAYLTRLAKAGALPPLRPRLPLFWGSHAVGSVESGWLDLFAQAGGDRFLRAEGARVHWLVQDDAALAEMAARMHAAGLGGPWRAELLGLVNDAGQRLARIERGAVRPLGLATEAVHLIGLAPDGRMWAQRRSLSKPNDPGLNDTLMGGMISATDGLQGALARETWEEAGLKLSQLQDLRHGGQVRICKPSRDGKGMGYMRETLHWFVCTVPEGVAPANQDGEVDAFELLTPAQVLARLDEDRFTTEAALVLAAAFSGRGAGPAPV